MKVSKSGFYEYLGRKKSNAQIEREALEGFVVEAFERHKGRYGYRRIDRELPFTFAPHWRSCRHSRLGAVSTRTALRRYAPSPPTEGKTTVRFRPRPTPVARCAHGR